LKNIACNNKQKEEFDYNYVSYIVRFTFNSYSILFSYSIKIILY